MNPKFGCFVLLCALALPCAGQTAPRKRQPDPTPPAAPAPPSPTDKVKVDKITYAGTAAADYAQDDFAAATGLVPGTLTIGDILKGDETLANSGQFASVEHNFDGTTLIYKVTAVEHLYPVHFENFAWWSDIDLLRLLHAKNPLFVGTLAGKGQLEQAVLDNLTAMATGSIGAPAKVELSVLTKPSQPPYAVAFSITSPSIIVGNVELAHGSLDMSASVAEISHRLIGQPYNRDSAREYLTTALGQAYAANGYIDMTVKQFQATDPRKYGDGYAVTVTGNLESGPQYHISDVIFAPTPQMTQAQFDAANTLKAGDVANLTHLQATIRNIERTYQLQGYVNAKVTAKPTLDHEHATVAYEFTVEPGTAFHTD